MGILDLKECSTLIEVLDRLQDTEERLYHFVKARADYEKDEEKPRSSIKR